MGKMLYAIEKENYNFEHIGKDYNLPVGTLQIPAFLIHDNKKVCSRGILQKAERSIRH